MKKKKRKSMNELFSKMWALRYPAEEWDEFSKLNNKIFRISCTENRNIVFRWINKQNEVKSLVGPRLVSIDRDYSIIRLYFDIHEDDIPNYPYKVIEVVDPFDVTPERHSYLYNDIRNTFPKSGVPCHKIALADLYNFVNGKMYNKYTCYANKNGTELCTEEKPDSEWLIEFCNEDSAVHLKNDECYGERYKRYMISNIKDGKKEDILKIDFVIRDVNYRHGFNPIDRVYARIGKPEKIRLDSVMEYDLITMVNDIKWNKYLKRSHIDAILYFFNFVFHNMIDEISSIKETRDEKLPILSVGEMYKDLIMLSNKGYVYIKEDGSEISTEPMDNSYVIKPHNMTTEFGLSWPKEIMQESCYDIGYIEDNHKSDDHIDHFAIRVKMVTSISTSFWSMISIMRACTPETPKSNMMALKFISKESRANINDDVIYDYMKELLKLDEREDAIIKCFLKIALPNAMEIYERKYHPKNQFLESK